MTNAQLSSSDFPAFFRAVWEYDPFPWQTRLLETVTSLGWPATLDLPTASGKTGVLDVAVFSLALEATASRAVRRAPMRIVFVIDRRVVVDQAYERARMLALKLAGATNGILRVVADQLRSIHGRSGEPPLVTAALRGGMPREHDWARSPDQPCILVSTVDQVGSRLLFRGYGVSDSMSPVHAGLLGEDVLYLLDEVHLSRPFQDTLAAVRHYGSWSEEPNALPHRFEFVAMSATPGTSTMPPLTLGSDDWNHPVLGPRLKASKPAALRLIDTPKDETRARQKMAEACVSEMCRLTQEAVHAEIAAIIVNRVDTARRIAELAEGDARLNGWTVHLMTGRMRPLDRAELFASVLPLVAAGTSRGSRKRTLLVSTQAIEAGADFDFDIMVTECASLDALRQRFGRLDRLGTYSQAQAAIVAGSSQVAMRDDDFPVDPVYGQSLARTWNWLSECATSASDNLIIDLGTEAVENVLRAVSCDAVESLLASCLAAPVLLPAHIDLWAQTAPRPAVEPFVEGHLHGPERRVADVQIVWRADIDSEGLRAASEERESGARPWTNAILDIVNACPPSSLEAMSVPIVAARVWLASIAERDAGGSPQDQPPVADVEGEADSDSDPRESDVSLRIAPALIWRGDEGYVASTATSVLPGSTVIVPATYGGIHRGTWDPTRVANVADRGDEAQLLHRGKVHVRWHGAVIAGWSEGVTAPQLDDRTEEELGPAAERDAFATWAGRTLEMEIPTWSRAALESTLQTRYRIIRIEMPPVDGSTSLVWRASTGRQRVAPRTLHTLRYGAGSIVGELGDHDGTSDGDAAQFTGASQPLRSHLERVRELAASFAESLGLGEAVTNDLVLAAWLHDVGKVDSRFQLWLHEGDRVRASLATEPLAKSGTPSNDSVARKRARLISGYPERARHELLSVALVMNEVRVREQANDLDLVLHLIGSHHGHCRPLAPPVHDPAPQEVAYHVNGFMFRGTTAHELARIDAGVAERFWRLIRRYGWWRLAWLEGLLRLADHRASSERIPDEE